MALTESKKPAMELALNSTHTKPSFCPSQVKYKIAGYPFTKLCICELVCPVCVHAILVLFASNSRSNFCIFPSSHLGNHVFFQRTIYSVPDTDSLLSNIFMISYSSSSTCTVLPCT